jgi:hypothetical protein
MSLRRPPAPPRPTTRAAAARRPPPPPPPPAYKGVVVRFDREAGVGEIEVLGGEADATFPVAARDLLSCGHRWLGVGEGVEFRVGPDGRAVNVLRSFEPARREGGGGAS